MKKVRESRAKKEEARGKMPEDREESKKREKQYRKAENLFNLDAVPSLHKDDQTRRVVPEQNSINCNSFPFRGLSPFCYYKFS